MPVPLILCIDVEPEAREMGMSPDPDWPGFEEVVGLLEGLRARAAGPAHFCWFIRLDRQIAKVYGDSAWPIRRYRSIFEGLRAQGDEIGVHTHAYRWDGEQRRWVSDHANQPWVDRCVLGSLAAFEDGFGRRPRSFRFGDRWMNDDTVALLDRQGIEFDLTSEPGKLRQPALRDSEGFTGSLPDTRMIPSFPYRPAPENYRVPGTDRRRKLWLIPVTTGPDDSGFQTACNLAFPRPTVAALIDRALASPDPAPVLVCRTGDHPSHASNIRENLDLLANHPMRSAFRFCTPAEAIEARIDAPTGWTPPALLFGDGFHGEDGDGRWMAQAGSIEVTPQHLPARLVLELTRSEEAHYDAFPFEIRIRLNGKQAEILAFDRHEWVRTARFDLGHQPLGARLELRSEASFVPAAVGQSEDARTLSVRVRGELTPLG